MGRQDYSVMGDTVNVAARLEGASETREILVGPTTYLIVDPIDGNSFWSKFDPNWRIHLALRIDDRIELAVVGAPALGVRWWSEPGEGAFEADWPMGKT